MGARGKRHFRGFAHVDGTKVFVNALELENERGPFTQLLNIPNFVGIW